MKTAATVVILLGAAFVTLCGLAFLVESESLDSILDIGVRILVIYGAFSLIGEAADWVVRTWGEKK